MIRYDIMVDYNKIEIVYKKICASTKHRRKLIHFELFKLANFMNVYMQLHNRNYKHGKYNIFLIRSPKHRIIMSENLHDKLVNHLVSLYVLSPIIESKLLDINVATRKNKGLDKGIFFIKKYLNDLKKEKDNIYVLKCDISKYFYNIDHEILIAKLRQIIYDDECINLIKSIINSTDCDYVNRVIERIKKGEIDRINKANLTDINRKIEQTKIAKIPIYRKGKGLPIGNMTSQILAIFYLNDMDHYIKEQLHIKYYIRYMDDFILFHKDKQYLEYCHKMIVVQLDKLKLKLNGKTEIFNLHNGLNFLGYRFIIKKQKLILLPISSMRKRIRRRYRNEGMLIIKRYNGYLKRCKSGNLKYKLKGLPIRKTNQNKIMSG